jgi:hypothetical protein
MGRMGDGTRTATAGVTPLCPQATTILVYYGFLGPRPKREGWHMENVNCPKCGHETAAEAACPGCGHDARNGKAQPARTNPPAPSEVANWVIYPTPPEMLKHLRETFDEAEYLAAVREVEKTGGVRIDDLIDEIERKLHGSP